MTIEAEQIALAMQTMQLFKGAHSDDFAVIDDRQSIASVGFFHEMGGQCDGMPRGIAK